MRRAASAGARPLVVIAIFAVVGLQQRSVVIFIVIVVIIYGSRRSAAVGRRWSGCIGGAFASFAAAAPAAATSALAARPIARRFAFLRETGAVGRIFVVVARVRQAAVIVGVVRVGGVLGFRRSVGVVTVATPAATASPAATAAGTLFVAGLR